MGNGAETIYAVVVSIKTGDSSGLDAAGCIEDGDSFLLFGLVLKEF